MPDAVMLIGVCVGLLAVPFMVAFAVALVDIVGDDQL